MPLPSARPVYLPGRPPIVSTVGSPLRSAFVESQPCNPPVIAKQCPCNPPARKRRTPATGSSRFSRRYRHCTRIDSMELTPNQLDLPDFADLSQLPVEVGPPNFGPGPIRRRKTSLRSTPFPQSPAEPSPPSSPTFPFVSVDPNLRDPRTPPHDPIPESRIEFRNLLPTLDRP